MTRKEVGRPVKYRGIFKQLDKDTSDEERDEDIDENSDLEAKIRSFAFLHF